MTDEVTNLMDANAHLRNAIEQVLKLHPQSKPVHDAIAERLDPDLGDRLANSPEQLKQNQIAFLKRALANLRQRARALIGRHPDVAGLFEGKL